MRMKTKIIIIFASAALAMIGAQALRIRKLTADCDRHQANASALLGNIERYKTKDSLNVARAEVLTFRVAELERYRADAAQMIKSLDIRKRDLEQMTAAQARTIAELRGSVADTLIIYKDRLVADTAQTLHVSDEWIDLHGVIYDGSFDGTLEVRDTIVVVESVERHRFLGFLWRTKKIRSHKVDVTSKNPYTEIVGVESIKVEK